MNNVIEQLIPAEQKKIAAKWKSTGLLNGCDGWEEIQLASILENQHLLNGMLEERTKLDKQVWGVFKRLTIPIVRRCFDPQRFVPHCMVSIQCMASPNGLAYYLDRHGVFKNTQIQAKGKALRTKLPLILHHDALEEDIRTWWDEGQGNLFLTNTYPEVFDHRSQNMIDNESELIFQIGRDMCQEITKEIIQDIRGITDLHLTHVWKSVGKFADFLRIASSELGREVGGEANWVVVSKELARELTTLKELNVTATDDGIIRPDVDVFKLGDLQRKWTIIVNPDAAANEVIIGKRPKDNPLDAGYFYCPYCPMTFQLSTLKKPDTNHAEDTTIVSRYSKKATNTKFYALVNVIGFATSPMEELPQNYLLPTGTGRTIVLDDNEVTQDEVALEIVENPKEVSPSELTSEEIAELKKIRIPEEFKG